MLPALRPTSAAAASAAAAFPAASETSTSASSADVGAKVVGYDEDWHRPPSDISYLQDLLASLEARQQQQDQSPLQPQRHAGPSHGIGGEREKEEEREMAGLRMRERQVALIERRRRHSRRRCDAVEEAFQKALERRLQAMRHLAADPPAERLVGQGMTQYVPAALLPDDVVDSRGRRQPGPLPLLPRSVVESRMHGTSAASAVMGGATAALTDRPAAAAAAEQDAIVFLTQLDAGGRPMRADDASASRSPTPPPARSATAEAAGRHTAAHRSNASASAVAAREVSPLDGEDDDVEAGETDAAWSRPAAVTEANRMRWHELGYHVVVVGGEAQADAAATAREASAVRRAIRSAAAAASAALGDGSAPPRAEQRAAPPPPPPPPATSSPSSSVHRSRAGGARAKGGSVAAAWEWMRLAPLPQVCLVQRRLPEEDMSAAQLRGRHLHRAQQQQQQLRHRQPQHSTAAASTTDSATPRGRPTRQVRSWRVGSKSAPH